MLTVIGAGLPRTGTTTLKAALAQLLEGPCHHMSTVTDTDIAAFTDAARGHSPNWDEIYRDYRAAVDWPTSAFYKELSDHYPNALVILSTRDHPRDWATSMTNTVIASHQHREDDHFTTLFNALWTKNFTTKSHDPTALEDAYTRHCDDVRNTIPSDRLLEWNARQGWEPLCQALGLPIPTTPFPHLNTTADFQKQRATP